MNIKPRYRCLCAAAFVAGKSHGVSFVYLCPAFVVGGFVPTASIHVGMCVTYFHKDPMNVNLAGVFRASDHDLAYALVGILFQMTTDACGHLHKGHSRATPVADP